MAVTITQTPTQGFTWAGSTWDWNDVRATGRTWETATAYEYSVHEQDAAPGFASASARAIADAFNESFSTASVYTDVAVWALNALESLALIETYTDFAEWLNDIQEVFDFAEADATAYSQQFLEQWLSLDADATGIDRQTAESLGLAEVYAEVASFLLNAAEALGFAEVSQTGFNIFRNLDEPLLVGEGFSNDVAKSAASLFALAEQAQRVNVWLRATAESLGVVSADATGAVQGFAEALGMAEQFLWQAAFARFASSLLAVSEQGDTLRSFRRDFNESFAFAESKPSGIQSARESLVAFGEGRASTVAAIEPELLAFAETYSDLIDWIQANSESFGIASVRSAAMGKLANTLVALRSALLRNANGVFGDVSIRNSAITLTDFIRLVATRHPEGYAEMKQFLPGDYRFQDAIVGIVAEPVSGANSDIAVLQAKTTTDVQDLHDRGSASISTAGLTINLNRVYTVPPEIQVTVTAGASLAIPQVTTITTTSFFVRLYQASNPANPVAGSISWSAIGY